MKLKSCILLVLGFNALALFPQSWTLRLMSTVEKEGKGLAGASIKLFQGSKLVNQSLSGQDGDFTVDIPPNGDYMLLVAYGDCNTKKFQISTFGVPAEVGDERFRPSFEIGGVTMSKPLFSIDYSALNSPLVKIGYMADGKKFDHDENHTEQMLIALGKIRDAEKSLIQKQQESCKLGDVALKKKDCELAKQHYDKAISLIPQAPYENYPKEQLSKVQDCLNQKQQEANKQNEALKAREEAEKAAAQKRETERLVKEKEEADKLATEKAAKEKAELDKKAAEAAALAKAESEKLAKEKLEADKRAAEQAAKEKAERDQQAATAAAASKAEAERLAREKTKADQLAAEKAAKEESDKDKQATGNKSASEKSTIGNFAEEKPILDPATSPSVTEQKQAAPSKEPAPAKVIENTVQKPTEQKTEALNAAPDKAESTLAQDKVIKPKASGKSNSKKKKRKKRSKSHYSIKQKL